MSFYLNDFKAHLQNLSDKVDHPYDEPVSRMRNQPSTSLEETYSTMKNRSGAVQLNEQYGSTRPALGVQPHVDPTPRRNKYDPQLGTRRF